MAAYVNKGNFGASTGNLTLTVPTGYTAGNLFIMLVEDSDQAITTPSGWTLKGDITSTDTKLAVYYKIVTASESSVVINDTGDHTTGMIFEFSGVDITNPIQTVFGTYGTIASSRFRIYPTLTTTQANQLVVLCQGNGRDATLLNPLTDWIPDTLDSITVAHDQISSINRGGGIALAYGNKAVIGDFNASLVSICRDIDLLNAYYCTITIALNNAGKKINNVINAKWNGIAISKYNGI